VVSVVVSDEHIFHGLRRKLPRILHGEARAAGKVRIHHDQVIGHLDDHVVAVSEMLDIAFAKPHSGGDAFGRIGLRGSFGDEK